ncbi:MAG: TetR/AcrR family transcriptional regulator [Halothermotrichaceae bacterium]
MIFLPKETFFNLSEKKQERIIEAALDEFSNNSYHKSRITAIVDKAGIASGSFYQYFDNKKDLFKYIIEQAVNKKLEYINHDMMADKESYDFFQLLHEMYLSGIKFAKENPRLVSIGNIFLNNKELQREIWGENKNKSSNFFKQLLKERVARGELDPTIDVDLISRLLTNLNYSLVDIIYKDNKIDPDKIENEMDQIDKMISFIKSGIENKSDS